MKKQTFKSLAMAAVLALATSNVQAQGFFKKLSKGIDKATRAIDKGTKELDKVTTNLTGDTNATQDNTSSATDSTKINKEYLIDDAPHYTVKKVYETAENGDTLRNDDGTIRAHYLVFDKNDKVCDANTAQKMSNSRLKAYGNILAKVGGGAALGVAAGLLSKDKKAALAGGLTGALAGLALSSGDMKKIKELNKSLKAYKSTLAAYQKTFTEEGLPIDATVDLSNVDGIDFTKADELTKEAAEVKAELAASKVEGESLEDLDIAV